MDGNAGLSRLYQRSFLFLLAAFLLLSIISIDRSCLDAADSAYMISSDAISRGLVPYSDFLAAHPPLLYILGAPLAGLGAGVIPFRIFSILVMAGLALAVWRFALRITDNSGTAFLAGAFTLFAPLGIYFSKLFIQDSLVTFIGVTAMVLLLGGTRRRVAGAGLLCIMATLTKLIFLPLLAVMVIYTFLYRRREFQLFFVLSVAGSLILALALEAATGGAYFVDIIISQASKGYSVTNFYQGLHRIWQMDWPLIVAAVPGLWFAFTYLHGKRDKGQLFLLLGWLAAGVLVLATLPAEGHDTNLFQLAEPALALLAAWGIMGLAERGKTVAVAAALILLIVNVVVLVAKDRSFLNRSNAGDVHEIVNIINSESKAGEAVVAPGCYALEAGRQVTRRFYDQFLWEEKYRRGDSDAIELFNGLRQDIYRRVPPLLVFEDDRESLIILGDALSENYQEYYHSSRWPPVTLFVPSATPGEGLPDSPSLPRVPAEYSG